MNNSEHQEIIDTLDRIIAIQDEMIKRMDGMMGKMDEMIENISSENKLTTYDGPR